MRYRLRDSQPSESSPEPPRGPGGRFPRSFLVPGGLPPPPSAGLSVFASGLQDQHGVPDCLNIKLASCPPRAHSSSEAAGSGIPLHDRLHAAVGVKSSQGQ
eukprot:CAMPEP_0171552956 /NCGR_PEP_ID=MMETSP0960-20121227/8664_1 /TAXON_ID=87120 /ORGANISM="Aurantiochytrium limacinum, Strain ATCCMYA-1381" /LENGTH=100 /DNA_ID=CAMNT_0012102573 /DNA_START=743 /DNA_END=1042 /DNA_ORIENTATION=+